MALRHWDFSVQLKRRALCRKARRATMPWCGLKGIMSTQYERTSPCWPEKESERRLLRRWTDDICTNIIKHIYICIKIDCVYANITFDNICLYMYCIYIYIYITWYLDRCWGNIIQVWCKVNLSLVTRGTLPSCNRRMANGQVVGLAPLISAFVKNLQLPNISWTIQAWLLRISMGDGQDSMNARDIICYTSRHYLLH